MPPSIDISSSGVWSALCSRLVPLPFRGRDLLGGEVLLKAAEVDKEEEQMEKGRLLASRKGRQPRSSSRSWSRTRSRSRCRPPAQKHPTQKENTASASKVLPFALTMAPRVFTKLLVPLAAFLHFRTMSMFSCIIEILPSPHWFHHRSWHTLEPS